MKSFLAVALAVLVSGVALAATPPDWAFPVLDPSVGLVSPPPDDGAPQHAPGSSVTYTRPQLSNLFIAKDWFPDAHPSMPAVVVGKPDRSVWACAACHMPNGMGHPESASLAGLPAGYITRQVHDMQTGARKALFPMPRVASQVSEADLSEADRYFSSLKRVPWEKVIVTSTVPVTFIRPGGMRMPRPGDETEPLGDRIIELPQAITPDGAQDTRYGFVAYVQPSMLERGKKIVTTGAGVTMQCATCHGADLHGAGPIPFIAGRSPEYVFRQLYDFQTRARAGANAGPMQGVTAGLTIDDMTAVAAYLASRT